MGYRLAASTSNIKTCWQQVSIAGQSDLIGQV
ncbi:uncharacterized protein G2W53_005473 [Senna tora]|uniref:Uncharacterized protein n=1 Tax=Senna tora TaxID=362788 RepID=A0A834X2J3_9FABA|nr:uncharacterized protein G2W53_005473 [Senna tora]